MGSSGPLKALESLARLRQGRRRAHPSAGKRPPFPRKPLFEALEKRFLLAAELAVIPPQDVVPPPPAVTAPIQVDAGFDLAAVAEAKLLQEIGGKPGTPTAPAAPGAPLVLDLSAASTNLAVTFNADGSAGVAGAAGSAVAQDVAQVKGGSGDDTYLFQDGWGSKVIAETAGGGTDTLDFSAIRKDLTFTVHADGSVTVSDGTNVVDAANAEQLIGGQGRNVWIYEHAPAGPAGPVQLPVAVSQLNVAREVVIVDPAIERYETLIQGILKSSSASTPTGPVAPNAATTAGTQSTAPAPAPDAASATGGAASALASDTEPQTAAVQNAEVVVPETPAPRSDVIIHVLDAARDGIEQIAEVLNAYQGLAAVHVLSHGSSGSLNVGATLADKTRLAALSAWGKALKPGGDVLLYGCDVAAGEAGVEFVERLSVAIGADVAASTNATGAAARGGDWVLEASTGVIETASLFGAGFDGYAFLLETINGTAGNDLNLNGTSAVDTVNGLGGNDRLNGLGGNDTLAGGTGNDTYVYTSGGGSDTVNELANQGTDTLDFSALAANLTFMIKANGEIVVKDGNTVLMTAKNVENIISGSGNDTFILERGASLQGTIDAGGGTQDTIAYSYNTGTTVANVDGQAGYTAKMNVDVVAHRAIGINGNASNGFSNVERFIGGRGADAFTGGTAADFFSGGRGNDVLNGNAGDDTLNGNFGDDMLTGGAGADTLSGGAHHDTLIGGDNNDTLDGGADDDTYVFAATFGSDTITDASGTADTVDLSAIGTSITFTINAGATAVTAGGNQVTNADGGVDRFIGGTGLNTWNISAGWNRDLVLDNPLPVSGGPTAILNLSGMTAALTITIKPTSGGNQVVVSDGTHSITANNIADITGGSANDAFIIENGATLYGDLNGGGGAANTLSYAPYGDGVLVNLDDAARSNVGPGSADPIAQSGTGILGTVTNIRTLAGSTEADVLAGINDTVTTISGGDGSDYLLAGDHLVTTQGDALHGEGGNDTLVGSEGQDGLFGGAGIDHLQGGGSADVLEGGSGNDQLEGGAGADTLVGGAGNDVLTGGADNDLMDGGTGDDNYVFDAGWGANELMSGEQSGKDTLNFNGVSAGLTFAFNGLGVSGSTTGEEVLTVGNGTFTRDPDLSVTDRKVVTGTFAGGDKLTVDHFEDFEDIVTGTGANTFLFNKIEHSFTIDAADAASLVLDFRASVQAMKFVFTTTNGVTTLTIFEDSAILSGLSVFSDSFLPKITVVDVDANTTIWGGRNSNNFMLKDGATFAGTIEGGTGVRLATVPLTDTVVVHPATLTSPLTGVVNALDYSEDSFLRPKIVNLGSVTIGTTTLGDSATGFGTVHNIEDVRYGASILNLFVDTDLLDANTFSSGTALFPNTGIHVFAGLGGADTYKFKNLWGLGVVIEPPDVEVNGEPVPEFFDTLDFSEAFGDFRIEITNLQSDTDLDFVRDLLEEAGFDASSMPELTIGTNFVTVTELGPVDALRAGLDAIGIGTDFIDDFLGVGGGSSKLYALDIENIVTSKFGNTKIVMKNGAELKGTIVASTPGGTVDLDYSEYGSAVHVDAGAGANVLVPGVSLGFYEGGPSAFTFGSATGIGGHRLSGATDLLVQSMQAFGFGGAASEISDFLGDFAVSGIRNITGTEFDDTLIGNYKANVITSGGGADELDGTGDSRVVINPFGVLGIGARDTVDLSDIGQLVTVNLATGLGIIDNPSTPDDSFTADDFQDVILGSGGGSVTGTGVDNVFSFKGSALGTWTVNGGGGVDPLDFAGVASVAANVSTAGIVTATSGGTVTTVAGGNFDVRNAGSVDKPAVTLTQNALIAATTGPGSGTTVLTIDAAFNAVLAEAKARWAAVAGGYTPAITAAELSGITFAAGQIVDLPGTQLAKVDAVTGKIQLDTTAAGLGWYVDTTLAAGSADSEFPGGTATAGGALGKIDLLTVLMHEIGHAVGLGHDTTGLMDDEIAVSTRVALPPASGTRTASDEANLAAGLDAFADWVQGFGPKLEDLLTDDLGLPFVNLSFADLFGIDPGFGTDIFDSVSANIISQVQSAFNASGGTFTTAGLDGAVGSITRTDSSTLKEFRATVNLSTYTAEISLDDLLGSAAIGDFGLTTSDDFTFDLNAQLNLDFLFGIDNSGNFYVQDPGVTAKLFLGSDANDDGAADPFDVGLKLGPVAIGVENGILELEASLRLGADGRISYTDLVQDTVSIADFKPAFDADSHYLVDLPIVLGGALSGVAGDGIRIHAESGETPAFGSFADFFLGNSQYGGLSLDGINFDQLLDFKGVSLDTLLDGINQVLDTLADPDGPLYDKIPLINESVIDLLGEDVGDFIALLRDTVDTVQSSLENIQQAEDALNAALQPFFGADVASLTYEDSTIILELDIEKAISTQIQFNLDLDDIVDIPDALGDVNLASTGLLDLEAIGRIVLGVGLDLSDVLHPELFFTDDTGVSATLAITGSSLDIDASVDLPGALPTVGIAVIDGAASVVLSARMGLDDDSADDGRYALSELASNVDFNVEGSVALDLPLFFPTPTLPMGGTTEDRDADGRGDNVLHLEAGFDLDGLQLPELPSLDFASAFSLFAQLQDPQNIVNGLDALFENLREGFVDQIGSLNLPLIGDAIADAANFIDDGDDTNDADLRDKVVEPIKDFFDRPENAGKSTVDLLKEALFGLADSPGDPLYGLLMKPVEGPVAGGFDIETDNGFFYYGPVTSADDIQFAFDNEHIQFNIILGGNLLSESFGIDFGGAVPGFGLEIDADILVTLDYVFGMGIGISTQGFYLDTSGATADGEELILQLTAALEPNASLTGTLAFLELALVEDADDDGASRITGTFSVDIRDPVGSDDRLMLIGTTTDVGAFAADFRNNFVVALKAGANVDLFAEVRFDGAEDLFPSLTTTIHYDQTFVNASSAGGASFGDAPNLVFEDVTLNVGEFFTELVGPILTEVKKVTEPLQPVIDFLTTPIPVVSDLRGQDTSPLDLLQAIASELKANNAPDPYKIIPAVEIAIKVVRLVSDIVTFINSLPDFQPGEMLLINFGTFSLADMGGGTDLRDPNKGLKNAQTPKGTTTNAADAGKAGSFLTKTRSGEGGFKIPLLDSPSAALGLLMGKTVDLVTYTVPNLTFDVLLDFKSPPFYPGFIIGVGVNLKLAINLTIGFDTYGINKFVNSHNPLHIFEGFYVSDNVRPDGHGPFHDLSHDAFGEDHPEVSVTLGVQLKLGVGIGGLVELGLRGRLEAGIYANLNDTNHDGKMRLDEIIEHLAHGGICVFDFSGQVAVGLDFFLWVGLDLGFFGEITIFEQTWSLVPFGIIASFVFHCPEEPIPVPAHIADIDGDGKLDLVLHMGQDAGDRWPGSGSSTLEPHELANGEPDPNADTMWNVNQIFEDPTQEFEFYDGNGVKQTRMGRGHIVVVDYEGFQQEFVGTADALPFDGTIIGRGGTGAETVIIGKTVTSNVRLTGGGGNDQFRVNGKGKAELYGGDGDDVLIGGTADDYIVGGAGNDQIRGIDGNDRLYGGAGDDVLDGGKGVDHIEGGVGADALVGGDQNDWLFGYADTTNLHTRGSTPYFVLPTIPGPGETGLPTESLSGVALAGGTAGSDGNDSLIGDGDDQTTKQPGNDHLDGGAGNDRLSGNKGVDRLLGGDGDDSLNAGLGNDAEVSGGAGNDTIYYASGDGADLLVNGGSGANERNTLYLTANDLSANTVSADELALHPEWNIAVVLPPRVTEHLEAQIAGNVNYYLGNTQRLADIGLPAGATASDIALALESRTLATYLADHDRLSEIGLDPDITDAQIEAALRANLALELDVDIAFETANRVEALLQAGGEAQITTRLNSQTAQIDAEIDERVTVYSTTPSRLSELGLTEGATPQEIRAAVTGQVNAEFRAAAVEDIFGAATRAQVADEFIDARFLADRDGYLDGSRFTADANAVLALAEPDRAERLDELGLTAEEVAGLTTDELRSLVEGALRAEDLSYELPLDAEDYQIAEAIVASATFALASPAKVDGQVAVLVAAGESLAEFGLASSSTAQQMEAAVRAHADFQGASDATVNGAVQHLREAAAALSEFGLAPSATADQMKTVVVAHLQGLVDDGSLLNADSHLDDEVQKYLGDRNTLGGIGVTVAPDSTDIDIEDALRAKLNADLTAQLTPVVEEEIRLARVAAAGTSDITFSAAGVRTSGDDLEMVFESSTFDLAGIYNVVLNAGPGRDNIVVNDLRATTVREMDISLGGTTQSTGTSNRSDANPQDTATTYTPDGKADIVTIHGSSADDKFTVTSNDAAANAALNAPVEPTSWTINQEGGLTFRLKQADNASPATVEAVELNDGQIDTRATDILRIVTGAGNDTIDASGVVDTLVLLEVQAGTGNDNLIGTPYADILNGGTDNDVYTGGKGVDVFRDAGGTDILAEQRAADFELTDDFLTIGGFVENQLSPFSRYFQDHPKKDIGTPVLDGTGSTIEQQVTYELSNDIIWAELPGTAPAVTNATLANGSVVLLSSMPAGTTFTVRLNGNTVSTADYTFVPHKAGHTGNGMIVFDAPVTGNVQVTYDRKVYDDGVPVRDAFGRVQFDADGNIVWKRLPDPNDPNNPNAFVYDTGTPVLKPGTGTVKDRIQYKLSHNLAWAQEVSDGTDGFTAGTKFYNDGFGRKVIVPTNTDGSARAPWLDKGTPLRNADGSIQFDAGGNILWADLVVTPTSSEYAQSQGAFAAQTGLPVETEDLTGGLGGAPIFETVRLAGIDDPGNSDPQIQFPDNRFHVHDFSRTAEVDGGGGSDRYVFELSGAAGALIVENDNGGNLTSGSVGLDTMIVVGTAGVDTFTFTSNDASSNLTDGFVDAEFAGNQSSSVAYNRTEQLFIHALGGDDLLFMDDSGLQLNVFSGDGDDNFQIGRVVSTELRDHDSNPATPALELVKLTKGVSASSNFYGGAGEDYFEVNHNLAEIWLYGETGDDSFVINAHLEAVKTTNVAGGIGRNDIAYVQNAKVNINGGEGFDTVVVNGTGADDRFIVAVVFDEATQAFKQIVMGAGIQIGQLESIERLTINGAGGDDDIHVFGTLPGLDLVVSGGFGNDTIHVGGEAASVYVDPPPYIYQPEPYIIDPPPVLGERLVEVNPDPFFLYLGWTSNYFAFHNLNYLNLLLYAPLFTAFKGGVDISVQSSNYFWFNRVWLRVDPRPYMVKETYVVEDLAPFLFVPDPVVVDPDPFTFTAGPTFTLTGIQAAFTIDGGLGDDRVVVNNQDGSSAATDTTAATTGFPGAVDRLVANEPLTFEIAKRNGPLNPLTLTITQQPQHGTVALERSNAGRLTGNVIYTPNAGYFGADQFSYSVRDTANNLVTATQAVSVDPRFQVSGMGMQASGIVYRNAEILNVELGNGNDTFTVNGTPNGSTLVINGNDGDDTINFRDVGGPAVGLGGLGDDVFNVGTKVGLADSRTSSINGKVLIVGGEGEDTVNFSDTGNTAATTNTLENNQTEITTTTTVSTRDQATPGGELFRETRTDVATRYDFGAGGVVEISEPTQVIATTVPGGTPQPPVDITTAVVIATTSLHSGTGVPGGTLGYHEVETLNIDLGSGNDTINVRGTVPVTTINALGGDDVFSVGTVAPLLSGGTVNQITAHLQVRGGSGRNVLNVDDSGDTGNNTGRSSATRITGLGMVEDDVPNAIVGGITYTGFAELNIGLGSGNDDFTIESTHAGTTFLDAGSGDDQVHVQTIAAATTVEGGEGDDTVNVGTTVPLAGSLLDSIDALLTVRGEGGADTLNLDDTGDGTVNVGTLTATAVNGLGLSASGVTYATLEHLNILLGGGADDFTIVTTHTAETTLRTGGGADEIIVQTVDGVTSLFGGAGNDTMTIGLDSATVSGIRAVLNTDGEEGADKVQVYVAGSGASRIKVKDTGTNMGHEDELILTATEGVDELLMRRNFIAFLHDNVVERIDYDGNAFTNVTTPTAGGGTQTDQVPTNANGQEKLTVLTLGGDDTIAIDDNDALTEIDMGTGDDRVQIGQLFRFKRTIADTSPSAHIADEDLFDTTQVTRGWLSNGISRVTTIHGRDGDDQFAVFHNLAVLNLNGNDGDDFFSVQAFVLANGHPADDTQFTEIDGGAGTNLIEYAANAKVNIAGGAGFDRVLVIGTEVADRFLITDTGVFGAGLNIHFNDVESLEVDGAEGDDEFYVLSTSGSVLTVLYGGLGSDTFYIAADGPPISSQANPIPGGIDSGIDTVAFPDIPAGYPDVPQKVNTIAGSLRIEGARGPGASIRDAVVLPTESDGGSGDFIPANPNLAVDEEEQVDTLNVYNHESTGNDTGVLGHLLDDGTLRGHLHGLGMGHSVITGRTDDFGVALPDLTLYEGITYDGLESVNIFLGSGNDTFTIESTHAGATMIDAGAGSDTINVRTLAGHTAINAGADADTINVGTLSPAAAGTVDEIKALLAVDGQGGADTMNVDDTGDTNANTGQLTQTTLTGLDMANADPATVNRFYTVTVNADGGTFRLQAGTAQTGPLAWDASAEDVRAALQSLPAVQALQVAGTGPKHDISVMRTGNTYLIGFQGALEGAAGDAFSLAAVSGLTSTAGAAGIDVATRTDGINYYGLETLNVNLGSGSDQFNVRGTVPVTNVAGNGGDDTFNVSSDGPANHGSLDRVTGTLNLDAGAGTLNRLNVSDFGDTDRDANVLVTESAISGLAPAVINYAATGGTYGHGVYITAGQGADTIEVRHVRANDFTHVAANGGNDTVTVSALTAQDGLLMVTGDGGADVVNASRAQRGLILFGDSAEASFGGQIKTEATLASAASIDIGQGGSDTIIGGRTATVMVGGFGSDSLTGQDGDDIVVGDNAELLYTGGTLRLVRSTDVSPATEGNDSIVAGLGRNIMIGGGGDETITSLSGDDVVLGDSGTVVFDASGNLVSVEDPGPGGNDTISAGLGFNIIIGGGGNDTILGSDGTDILIGDEGRVVFQNGRVVRVESINVLNGGNDILDGGPGRDILIGGFGEDVLRGNLSDDLLFGTNAVLLFADGRTVSIFSDTVDFITSTMYDQFNALPASRSPSSAAAQTRGVLVTAQPLGSFDGVTTRLDGREALSSSTEGAEALAAATVAPDGSLSAPSSLEAPAARPDGVPAAAPTLPEGEGRAPMLEREGAAPTPEREAPAPLPAGAEWQPAAIRAAVDGHGEDERDRETAPGAAAAALAAVHVLRAERGRGESAAGFSAYTFRNGQFKAAGGERRATAWLDRAAFDAPRHDAASPVPAERAEAVARSWLDGPMGVQDCVEVRDYVASAHQAPAAAAPGAHGPCIDWDRPAQKAGTALRVRGS